MTNSSTDFAVSDVEYNLVMTLSNLLQSEEVLERYAKDADEAGETEVGDLFRNMREHNHQVGHELRAALKRVITAN
ncbi:MAG: hypothetical protein M3440_10190 [Chloroflexota bacterium]|nr:hypothetical protein [Chloroflexota bacterium]